MAARLMLLAGLAGLLLAPPPAHAADRWKKNETAWMASDRCARAAFKEFPDYTPEGNAKREHAMQQCLAASNLPPRGPIAPANPPAAATQPR